MKDKKLVLVTGSTGLLGKGLEETLPAGWKILGVHGRPYDIVDAQAKHLVVDVRDKAAVDKLFKEHRFDAVIHAAGIASVDYVERRYEESLDLNLNGTRHIAEACRERGIFMVYVSTNAVFDGAKAPYRETDAVNPLNKYGQIKARCEDLVRETLKDYCIARPILMYGWNHIVGRPNPATWIFDKLMRGEKLHLVNDVFENPLYNRQCAEALWRILDKRSQGVLQLAGGEIISRYGFGMALAKVFDLDGSLIVSVDSSYFPDIAPRPKNTSFVTERMSRELGVKPLTVAEGLSAMKSHMAIKV